MANQVLAQMEVALSNGYLFPTACNNDVLFYCEDPTCRMLIGHKDTPTTAILALSSNLLEVAGDLVPLCNETFDIGTPDRKFRDLYLSGSTVYLGDIALSRVQDTNYFNITNVQTPEIPVRLNVAELQVADGMIINSNTNFHILNKDASFISLSNGGGTVTLYSDGTNLGIGQSNPMYTLDVNGSCGVYGDLIVDGTTATFNTTHLQAQTNLLILNHNTTGTPQTSFISGVEIKRGSLPTKYLIYEEATDRFKIGTANTLMSIATCEDTPSANGIPAWDPTAASFKTRANTVLMPSTGYIGIGTSVPSRPLHVEGNATVSSELNVGSLTHNSKAVNLWYQSPTTASHLYVNAGSNVGIGTSSPTMPLDVQGGINCTTDFFRNGTPLGHWIQNGTHVYVQTGSNVGIGSSTPTMPLDVAGNINVQNLYKNNVLTGQWNQVDTNIFIPPGSNVGIGKSLPGFPLDVSGVINATTYYQNGGPLVASQWSQAPSTSKVFIGTTSNVGIGTTDPGFPLDVNGTINATRYYKGGTEFVTSQWSQINANVFIGASSNVGIGTTNPGSYPLSVIGNASSVTIYTNGDISAFSDARYKTNLQVIDGALDRVRAIHGYTYQRTDNSNSRRQAGVLAQEVQQVLPEVVYAETDGTLSVAYANMVPLLLEAIKELEARVNALSPPSQDCLPQN